MEQETRKFAIEQAILLIKDNGSVNNKTKAVFDLAEQIVKYIGDTIKKEREIYDHFTPITPLYRQPTTAVPSYIPQYETTCVGMSTEQQK